MMAALTQLPAEPSLPVGNPAARERQLCEFILRGIGLKETIITTQMDRELSLDLTTSVTTESA